MMKTFSRLFLFTILGMALFGLASCGGGDPAPAPATSAPATSAPAPTAVPTATAKPVPTPTSEPVPEPTVETKPDPTATPKPTAVPATATPVPPTATPRPTATPVPPTPTPLPFAGLAVTCEDKTTHTYCISPDLATPPDKPSDPWGTKLDYSPEIFCGSDVTDRVCLWFAKSVVSTFQEFGLYAPTEFYVVGGDAEANQVGLAGVYCNRRVAREQSWGRDHAQCLALQTDPNGYKMESYRKLSEGTINDHNIQNSAALSGDPQAGYMMYYTSVLPGFHLLDQDIPIGPGTGQFSGVSGEIDQKIVFHEGYHSFQQAHILTMVHDERTAKLGPSWWNEGAAEWMAYVGMFSELEKRNLDLVTTDLGLESKFSFQKAMLDKMNQGKSNMAQHCPGQGIKDLSYQNQCYSQGNAVYYSLGAWAVAYLHDKKGSDFSTEFYGQLEALGWEGAFVATFGISSEEFYVEFDEFLELTWSKQKAILPDYD